MFCEGVYIFYLLYNDNIMSVVVINNPQNVEEIYFLDYY